MKHFLFNKPATPFVFKFFFYTFVQFFSVVPIYNLKPSGS